MGLESTSLCPRSSDPATIYYTPITIAGVQSDGTAAIVSARSHGYPEKPGRCPRKAFSALWGNSLTKRHKDLWLASGMAVTRTVPHSPPPPTRAQGTTGQKGQTDCKNWGWRGEPWDAGIWTWHAGGTNDLAASVVTCTRLVQGQVCQKFLHGAAKAHSCPDPSRGAIGSWSHFS